MASIPAVLRRCAVTGAQTCLLGLAVSPSASAAIIRYDFTAQVTSTQALPIFGISPTVAPVTNVSGYFTYDTEAVDLDPGDASTGRYVSGMMSISIGGLTLTSAAPATQLKYDTGLNDLWSIISGVTVGDPGILVNGVLTAGADMLLHFTQADNLLPGDAQPDLAGFNQLTIDQFAIRRDNLNGADSLVLFDTVTSSGVSVIPLPGTLPLLLAGGLGLVAARRRSGKNA